MAWEGRWERLEAADWKERLAATGDSTSGHEDPGRRRLGVVLAVFLFDPAVGPAILLTKRAAHLDEHPGQISFPGGAFEPGDAGLWAAALRETWEEVGLAEAELDFLGLRPPQPVLDRWLIYPHLAWWAVPRPLHPNPAEVAEILITPLADLTRQHQPGSWRTSDPDQASRFQLGDDILWGATARILARLLDRLEFQKI